MMCICGDDEVDYSAKRPDMCKKCNKEIDECLEIIEYQWENKNNSEFGG